MLMPDNRLPKQMLYGQLKKGKRSQGGQEKRYKDNIKTHLTQCQFSLTSWEDAALQIVHGSLFHYPDDHPHMPPLQ